MTMAYREPTVSEADSDELEEGEIRSPSPPTVTPGLSRQPSINTKTKPKTKTVTFAEDPDVTMAGLYGTAASAASSAAPATQGDISGDVQVSDPPTDSISDIAFSPTADYLAVSSWDSKVRIYEINGNGTSAGKALFEHDHPVLNCAWSTDGTKVFSGSTDKTAKMLDLGANGAPATQVAAHDGGIKCVETINMGGNSILVTGSWDKTVKYWDLRTPNPVATLQCQERIFSMDTRNQMLVIGTAERFVNIVNLSNPQTIYKTLQSPLKWQTRTVSCFTDATGFAIGSIEGRCAIQYAEDKDATSNFSFKCHRQPQPNSRDTSNVYSVNAISFHPQHGTFSTAGSDGTFHFWDKDAKHRLKGYPEVGGSIACTDFNHNGNIFAYAISYDWHQGYSANTQNYPNKVMLHAIGPEECKPRPKSKR